MQRLVISAGPAAYAVLGGLGLAAWAWASMSWRMAVDAPLLAYSALAIDRFGIVPYRDLFDFNVPGAYLANIAIGRAFGYSELGFRLADLSCLALLLTLTAASLRQFGWRVSCAGALLFGYTYLGYGAAMSLQREYLILLPIAMSLVVAFEGYRSSSWRATVISLLIGAAATIKPQAFALLPVFIGWLIWDQRCRRNEGSRGGGWLGSPTWQILLGAAVGVLAPLVATAMWLRSIGALDPFLDIASNYWPLYGELTGARPHHIARGAERWAYLAERFVLSRDFRHLLLIPAIVGVWLVLRRLRFKDDVRRTVVLLVGVMVVLELYPLAAGKFWGYHWLPSFYGASLLAALCFAPHDLRGDRPARGDKPSGLSIKSVPKDLVAAMVVLMITAQVPGLMKVWREARADVVVGEWSTAYQIADELRNRLQPGDEVQPLDWTGGAVHALFLTNTRMATPFLYDFYFYHHVSTAYIQGLRRKLIDALNARRPAFIVFADQKRRLEGPDTTADFDELTSLVRRSYREVKMTDRFAIYERADHGRGETPIARTP